MRRIVKHDVLGSGLWHAREHGHVYVEEKVLNVVDSYRQVKSSDKEAGGFLCGYYKGKDLHITELTTPKPKDIRGRYSFKRRDKGHVTDVTRWYKDSNGELNCLGEWHTHPERIPSPSSTDTSGWQLFNRNRNGQKSIFLIVGIDDLWLGECC